MGKELHCHKHLPVKCRCNVVSRKVVCWQVGKCIFVYKLARTLRGSAVVQKVQRFMCSIFAHLNLSITSTSSVEIYKPLTCLTLISWAALQVNAELLEKNNHSKLFCGNGIVCLSWNVGSGCSTLTRPTSFVLWNCMFFSWHSLCLLLILLTSVSVASRNFLFWQEYVGTIWFLPPWYKRLLWTCCSTCIDIAFVAF